MPDRSEVIDALMQSDPEPFDGFTSAIKYYGPMADAVIALFKQEAVGAELGKDV